MIRVLLAEDMAMVRGALVALLAYETDIEVVAELERGDDIVATATGVEPDVAVIDIGLPGMDGLTAARLLAEVVPKCQSLILTAMGTPRTLRLALDAKIRGFVVKDAPPSVLAESIRRVAKGECVIDSELASSALSGTRDPLTAREHDVLEAAAEGAPVSEIACRLCLAPGTVRNYLSVIISKLGARNRLDAVRIARDEGWI
jgi:two-component system, NarL family, response regulator DesR